MSSLGLFVVCFLVFVFCLLGFLLLFLLWFVCGDFQRPTGLCTGPYQFTLEAPQSADGHAYALIT